MKARKDRLEMIALADIGDNPFQIGYPPDEASVAQAAYLVRDQGMAFPIVVRPFAGTYQLGTGRRWLSACRLLGVRLVPALVVDLDDEAMSNLAFEEASLMGTISPTHGSLLLKSVADPRVANRMERLRRGEDGYRIEPDPEAARNLPLPQRFLPQATPRRRPLPPLPPRSS